MPCSIVTLCTYGEALVNLIVTSPAVAVSDRFVNLNRPLGSAAMANGPLWGVAVVSAEDPAGDVDDALLEPLQAATATDSRMLLKAGAGCLNNGTFALLAGTSWPAISEPADGHDRRMTRPRLLGRISGTGSVTTSGGPDGACRSAARPPPALDQQPVAPLDRDLEPVDACGSPRRPGRYLRAR